MNLQKKYRPLPKETIHFAMPGELHRKMQQYREYYYSVYNDEITDKELIEMTVETFFEKDAGFAKYCKDREAGVVANGHDKARKVKKNEAGGGADVPLE